MDVKDLHGKCMKNACIYLPIYRGICNVAKDIEEPFILPHNPTETTPTDFITGLITHFGQVKSSVNKDEDNVSLKWKDIGIFVSPILKRALGCCTMLGPMNAVIKQKKAAVCRTKPTTAHLPKEINNEGGERTDTDLNMATMFEILKNKKKVNLNCLILNRRSFAQTVENLFALSFLAKDGRVRIAVEVNGSHIVSPTNGPVANEVAYHHFVFRFDFKEWKIMMEMVAVGEELMPHRNHTKCTPASGDKPAAFNSQTDTPHTIQTRKHTRNDGLVVQDKSTAEEFLENDDAAGATALRRSLDLLPLARLLPSLSGIDAFHRQEPLQVHSTLVIIKPR
ncbi:hypothetical protein ACLB2K_021291 [Fragaria x ananassa]